MKINPVTSIDFYKADHRRQYTPGTNKVFSNFTPRSSRLFKGSKLYDEKVVVFGLQFFAKEFLIETWNEGFFHQPKEKVIANYKHRMDTSLGIGAIETTHIEALHDLGYLPISIRALKEGTRCPIKVPVLTITETIPEFFWLVNYLESVMSTELWKPMTNATIAYEYRRIFNHFAELTGANIGTVPFQGHDFSMRGLSGKEDGYKNGIAHLTSFLGTDTVLAIDAAEDYYNANAETELIGTSVFATEHSVMCMGNEYGEESTIRRLITELYPTGIVSIVSDTWDYWNTISVISKNLKSEIMSREPDALGFAKVVFRPDSGNPVDIICGTVHAREVRSSDDAKEALLNLIENETPHGEMGPDEADEIFKMDGKFYKCSISIDWNRYDKQYYYIDYSKLVSWEEVELTVEQKGSIEVLWDIFGGTINDKGFKVLDSHVGLIYGDSITLARQEEILQRLMDKGFSSENIILGIGSYTYQYNTRDTFGFAMKATYGEVQGVGRELFKDPKTDKGTKKSAKGLICVNSVDGELVLKDQITWEEVNSSENKLIPFFENGKLLYETSLEEIREMLK